MISADEDRLVMSWNVETGTPQKKLPLYRAGIIQSMVFSSNGETLGIASSDHTLMLWDVASGEAKGSWPVGYEEIHDLTFIKNDQILLVAGRKAATLWDIEPSTWKETACDLAGRNLTWDEWKSALSGENRLYARTCTTFPIHPTVIESMIAEAMAQGEWAVRQLKITQALAILAEANEHSEAPILDAQEAVIHVLFTAAREHFLSGDFTTAEEHLREIQRLAPKRITDLEYAIEAGQWFEKGHDAIAAAEYDRALLALNHVVELAQFEISPKSDLAMLYYQTCQGFLDIDVSQALSACESAVALADESESLTVNVEICQGGEIDTLTEIVSPSCHRVASLADEIAFGKKVETKIKADDDGIWAFVGQAGQRIRITMSQMSGGFGSSLVLLNSDGQIVDTSGAGLNVEIDHVLSQDGGYIIIGSSFDSSYSAYTLSLSEIVAQEIALGGSVMRDLEEDITWVFEGQAGQMIKITMDAESTGLDPYLRLLDPEGNIMAENDDSGGTLNARIAGVLLPQDGTYVIDTQGLGGRFGRYTLSLALEKVSRERIAFGDSVMWDLEEDISWVFEGQAGQMIKITMDAQSTDLDPYLRLLDSDGNVIAEDDDSGEEYNARIAGVLLPQDGTYLIETRGLGGPFGRYTLSLNLDEVFLERIAYGESFTRDLAEDIRWAFEGQAGQIVRIAMDAESDGLDPYLRLLGPDGNVIAEDDDSGGGSNARIFGLVLPQEGTYTIVTQGFGGSLGRYTLFLEELSPVPIAFGESFTRDLAEDILWAFEGQAGQIVRITMDAQSADLDPYLRLLDSKGDLVTQDNDGGEGYNARIAGVFLSQDGTYLIETTDLYERPGRYTLSLEELSPEPITVGISVTRDLVEDAFWAFEGQAGQMLNITMDVQSGDLDPYLRLSGPEGNVIAEDDDSGGERNARIVVVLPRDGAYVILATQQPGGSGGYTLRLEEVLEEPITFGEPVTRDYEDGIIWAFEGQSGQIVRIALDKSFSAPDAEFTMVLPDGTKSINRDSEATMVIAELVLPTTGMYRIIPHGEGTYNSKGTYILSLAEVTATGSITYGDTRSGTVVDLSGERWTFSADVGDMVKLTMTGDTFTSQIEVYTPTGTLQQRAVGSGPDGQLLLYFMPGVGTYIIVARGVDEDSTGPYTLTLERTETLPIPEICDAANVDYGPIAEGSVVILGRHRPVNGDTTWNPTMEQYVGMQARVTARAGTDGQGCPLIHVDIDNGNWYWRIRDLTLVSP